MSLPVKPNVSYPPSIHRAHEVITALSDAYDDLKAQYDYETQNDIPLNAKDIFLFNLTAQEGAALAMLEKNPTITVWRLLRALVPEEGEALKPQNQVRVVLHRIRKKIGIYGATIKGKHGVGYSVQNLELARENAGKGITVDYTPVINVHRAAAKDRWDEVLNILQEGRGMTVPEIVAKMTVPWPIKERSKWYITRLWLQTKEKEGVVSADYVRHNKTRAIVWQVCNTVA